MRCLINRIPLTILLLPLAISSISCSRKVAFDNPFDPNVSLIPPGGLQVVSMTDTTLTLRWSSSYKVHGASQVASSWIVVEESYNDTSFSVLDSLSAVDTTGTINKIFKTNRAYYFRIRERLSANVSSVSNTVKVEVAFPPPSGFQLTTASESTRQFTWQAEAGTVAGYRIERRLDHTGNYSVVGTVPSNTTTFTDTTIVITDTTYEYRLCAVSQYGDSSYFDSLSVLVPFPPPTHLRVASLSSTSIDVIWLDNHSFESGYKVWESVNGQPYNMIALLPATADSLMLTGLNESYTYSFEVAAVTKYNVSVKPTVSISFLNAPDALLYSFHENSPSSLAFSPNGSLLARSSIDSVAIYATGNGRELNSTSTFPNGANVPECSFSPDGKLLASNGSSIIDLWDSDTLGTPTQLPAGNYGLINCVAFAPDNNMLVATTDKLTVQVWDVADETKLNEFSGHFALLGNSNIAVSPDGRYVATGDSLALIDISTGAPVRTLSNSQTIGPVAFSPSGQYVACVGASNNLIMLYSPSNGALLQTFPAPGTDYNTSPGLFCFGPKSNRFVTAGSKADPSNVCIYDIQSGNLLTSFDTPSPLFSVAISPLGDLVAACNQDGTISVWALQGVWIINH